MSSNEKVYIVTESELEELVANKQTEALKTIYSIAKSNPNASWNELVVRSAEQLQNPGSVPAEPVETAVEEPSVDLLDSEEEDLLDESDITDSSLTEDTDDVDAEDEFSGVDDEPNIFDEDDNEAEASVVEEVADTETDVEDLSVADEDSEEDENDIFSDDPTPTTGVTPLSSFRNNDSRMIREASIFDD